MKKIYVALEGTLSDDSHRFSLKSESYEEYQNAVSDDIINEKLVNFLNLLSEDKFDIVVYSSTPENLRPLVNDLLLSSCICANEVMLKKKGDYRPEIDIKLEMFSALDKEQTIIVENNSKLADLLRQDNFFVLQV